MLRPLIAGFVFTTAVLHAEPAVEFNRDIRPILSDRCFYCHGPDEKTQEADLRIDNREGATRDLGGYSAIVPGKPEESELLHRMLTDDTDDLMPPPKSKKPRLTANETYLVRRWIEQGAQYQGHWAFEPVKTIAPPLPGHSIDAFVNARLAQAKIKPSPPADRHVLIRRAYLDLVGLLPTPEEVEAFVADTSPDAYEKLVDRLLASPHYGERWGRHWLDGARYADSHGYSVDGGREMWPFRDWVINALNQDMAFDQFTVEQIAGDLLPGATKSQIAATAFHRNTLINQEGGSDPEQFRVEATIDRVNTTAAVWLGLTAGCAQCHTHKFDPIPQREYYQMFAFFNAAEDRNNTGPTLVVSEGEMFPKPPLPKVETPAKKSPPPAWKAAGIVSFKTASGAPLKKLADGSLLVDKSASANESYQVVADTELAEVGAVRLRVLTDPSLPKNGPGTAGNGNFVLTGIELRVGDIRQKLVAADADHSQPGFAVTAAIDGNSKTGWAINVGKGSKAKMNAPHGAIFALAQPVPTAGKPVEIRLNHGLNENYLIGRFALDFSPTVPAIEAKPKSASARSGKLMVMRDIKKPRDTYLLTRGDFTRPDKEAGTLLPGVFSAIAPAFPEKGRPASRLDLARWLVSPENPLTPRVTVNRIWMRYFGIGLVETEEDFGTQGSLPSDPALLDYLAHNFVAEGWSMKKLHRLITTSGTYQRSSKARPDLEEIDARNLLLARQNRIRLDAEIVRDAALSASGLFEAEIGGPGVYPPQPSGIYAFTQSAKGWPTSTGSDRYRRGMYTFFYRSAPHPLFGTFDAPDFQTTCTRRPRSNTPLQALNLANDEAFIEFAQALAERIIEELPGKFDDTLNARINRAFLLALSRPPSADERTVLADYARTTAEEFAGDPEAAKSLLANAPGGAGGATPANQKAALVALARAIFNTDNFITRE